MTGGETDHPSYPSWVASNVTGTVIQSQDLHGPITVSLAPAQQDRLTTAAGQLAKEEHDFWRDEQQRRRIHDPRPLRLRWRAAAELLTDHRENILRGAAAGALENGGGLDQISEVYRQLPARRLVVLGRAGSGKTVLAVQLVVDLLAARQPDARVPVIVSLGAWKPEVSLADWLIGYLVRDHPWLAETGSTAKPLGAELVSAGWILPVLDGFDEISDGLRPSALRVLAESDLPLVLTSRPREFATAVVGTRGVHRAAVIELTNLALDDVTAYLQLASPKLSAEHRVTTTWDPVLSRLDAEPDNPGAVNLATALTTPLMVALARTIYSDAPDNDPTILLDSTRFPTAGDIEHHLLGNLIPSVYRMRPGSLNSPRSHHWNPEHARRWLSFLATQLDDLATTDLAWWELGTTLSRRTRTLVIGSLAGLIFLVVTGIGNIPIDLVATSLGFGFAVYRGVAVGVLHGLVGGLAFGLIYWLTDRRRALRPAPIRIRFTGPPRQLGARLTVRLRFGIPTGFLFAVFIVLVDKVIVADLLALDDGLTSGGLLSSLIQFPLLVGLGIGLVLTVMTWLETPINIKDAGSPADLLTVNRINVRVHMFVWALVFGISSGLVASRTATPLRSIETGLAIGLEAAFAGGLCFGLSLTAWGQWCALARIWLPLNRKLPWRLVTFLDDACQRGALRQAGAVYQFRHAQLRSHLSTSKPGMLIRE